MKTGFWGVDGRLRLVCVVVGLLVAIGGCASSADAVRTAEPAEVSEAAVVEPSVAEAEENDAVVDLEATAVGRKMGWLLEKINEEGGAISIAEFEASFDETFQKALPHPQLIQVLQAIAEEHAPLTPEKVVSGKGEAIALQVQTASGGRWLVSLAIDAGAPHRIVGLFFQPQPAVAEELPQDWSEIEGELASVAASHQLFVARVEGGRCEAIRAFEADRALAVGSTFKLYVLTALAQAVEEGRMSWGDTLAIEASHKSLPSGVLQDEAEGTTFELGEYADKMISIIPSGVLQDEAEGTTFELGEYADKMISISDNTATDHLIAHLGREAVEAAVESTGHHEPGLMRPFLFTHEFMKLKIGVDAEERDAFAALDEAGRRAYLQDRLARRALPSLAEAASWNSPRHVDSIEWFASATDLCQLHAHLVAHREREAYARAMKAMTLNDGGLRLPADAWRYVGFKGGSEPGVVHLSWLLQRADGAWFSVTIGANDPDRPADLMTVFHLGKAAILMLQE